jgi:tRNA threonylcarbamoyladenosine biosynthesis protein TsaE
MGMNTDSKLAIKSTSSDFTKNLAASIGARLKGGEVFALRSDLGGGKTTFTQGLVKGLGGTDLVSSPTFTIQKQYNTPRFKVWHYDFYRLQEPGVVLEELIELISDDTIVVIEWPETVLNELPGDIIFLDIEIISETERLYSFSYSQKQTYIFKEL